MSQSSGSKLRSVNGQSGFTLIELLVAVGIIGILASVSVVSVNSIRQKARDSKRLADIKEVQNALEAFYSNNDGYPGPSPAAAVKLGDATENKAGALCGDGFKAAGVCATAPTYMATVNANPAPGGKDFTYITTACATANKCPGYGIKFQLESGSGSLALGHYCATQDGIGARANDAAACP